MLSTLFTLGYQQRSLAEFLDLLQTAKIDVLVDVRATAWSHKPGFSKGALTRALGEVGIEYVHAAFAGNPKRFRTEASSHQECLKKYGDYLSQRRDIVETFDTLLVTHLSASKRICLTCFERHPDDCHRAILADVWRRRGRRKVHHLAPDGAPRLP